MIEKVTEDCITIEQFHLLTRPLIGLPVSRPWRGYGSAIFLELGKLVEENWKKPDGACRTTSKGEAGVMIEWSWRVEKPQSIWFGSWSGNRKITNNLSVLQGHSVVDITVEGRLPELVIRLSGGIWVHSFTTVEGQPQWCLFLRDHHNSNSEWVISRRGRLVKVKKL